MEAKKRLAFALTALYHGDDAARRAQAHFERVIQQRQEPERARGEDGGPPTREALEGKVWRPARRGTSGR